MLVLPIVSRVVYMGNVHEIYTYVYIYIYIYIYHVWSPTKAINVWSPASVLVFFLRNIYIAPLYVDFPTRPLGTVEGGVVAGGKERIWYISE